MNSKRWQVDGCILQPLDALSVEVVARSLHDCRQHDAARYLKCVEDGAVFDLDAADWSGRRPNFGDPTDPLIHVDWLQHNRFEGYVVKPEGSEPPERPNGAVKDHWVLAT